MRCRGGAKRGAIVMMLRHAMPRVADLREAHIAIAIVAQSLRAPH